MKKVGQSGRTVEPRDPAFAGSESEAPMKTSCPGFTNEYNPNVLFSRILVPVDFGPESRRALITACAIRQQFGSEIHVFHLSAQGGNDEYIRGLGAPWTDGDVERQAREQLKMFGESICMGMPCIYHDPIVGDDLVHGVAEAVEKIQATIVILPVADGEKSFWRTKGEKVARALHVPVLFLKGTAPVPATTTA
jgi:hypothetical protein